VISHVVPRNCSLVAAATRSRVLASSFPRVSCR
jgi:hypothetical protein